LGSNPSPDDHGFFWDQVSELAVFFRPDELIPRERISMIHYAPIERIGQPESSTGISDMEAFRVIPLFAWIITLHRVGKEMIFSFVPISVL
jgi:hypothetical protein